MNHTIDENRMVMKIELIDDEGWEYEAELPVTYEVCDRCRGKGSHVNPSIDGHGITAEEWHGPDWDDESREMYLTGGYDVPCEECDGKRVVPVVDEKKCNPETLERYHDYLSCMAELRREEAAERRFGC